MEVTFYQDSQGAYAEVTSETGSGKVYLVEMLDGQEHCSCPDHYYRRRRCKHMQAAEAAAYQRAA